MRTKWKVGTSEGFDALAFLGPLSGKPFYAEYYEAEIEAFAPRMSVSARSALGQLHADADADGYLLWPLLTLIFSGANCDSLEALLVSLDAADTELRPQFEASIYWDEQDWLRFVNMQPRLRQVLDDFNRVDFPEFWRHTIGSHAATRAEHLIALLETLDVIEEQQRLLGRDLDPQIDITLLWFCRPHGVKVQGQRFLAHVLASDSSMILIAAHENMHPPLDLNGPTFKACLDVLERDPLLARILHEKSSDTGYNTLDGILDEDLVQALDQIIQERFDVGETPQQRWTTRDEGMHVLAAALYGLLTADGYHLTGGSIDEWMRTAAMAGRLSPPILHRAAADVLHRPIDQLWTNPAAT